MSGLDALVSARASPSNQSQHPKYGEEICMGWRHYDVRAAGMVTILGKSGVPVAVPYELGFVDTGRSRVFAGYFVRVTLDTEGVISSEDDHSFFRAVCKLAALLKEMSLTLICAGTDPRWAESGLSFNSGWGYLPDHDAPVHIMKSTFKEGRTK
jgi:hypothetical protein